MREVIEYKALRKTRYFFIEEHTEKEVELLKKAVAGTLTKVMKNPDGSFSVSFAKNTTVYFELEIGDIIEVCLGRASLHKKLSYESVMIRKKFKNTDLLIDGCLVEKCHDSEDHLIKFDTINSDVSNYLWLLTGFIYYLKNLSSGRSYILCPNMAYASITQYSVWYLSGKQLIPSIEYNLEREKKMKKEKDLSWSNITETEVDVVFEFRRLWRELHENGYHSHEGPLPLLFAKIAAVGYAANVNGSPWFAPQTVEYEARRGRAMRAIVYLQNKKTDDLINSTPLGNLLRYGYEKQHNAPEEDIVSDIKDGFLHLAYLLGNEEDSEEFWNAIINSGFEYEKDELKKKAQLFIDSLNA